MKKGGNGRIKTEGSGRTVTLIAVILLNALLLTGAYLSYSRYISVYQTSLWEENHGNIANLNRSAAQNATTLIKSWSTTLDNIANYVELHEMTIDEALDFISDSNTHEERKFELINSDYTGFFAKKDANGGYAELNYSSSSFSKLKRAFDDADDDDYVDICFTPEFTDNGPSKEKSFAIYKHINISDGNGAGDVWTLLLVSDKDIILEAFNSQDDYKGQSTVLIDPEGNYIVSNNNFKSTNLFSYFKRYEELSLDETNQIKQEVFDNGDGYLYRKNGGAVVEEDCVYRYERMSTNGWYAVTCVPISSFRGARLNSNYVAVAAAMLIAMLIVDVVWLWRTNGRLRISMQREKEASAAKGNFMSRMSHEIRTPLNAVIGYNTLAQGEISGVKNVDDYRQAEMRILDCLTKSDIASKHLLTIINDVLDMSAIESGKIITVNERFDFKGLITSLTTVMYAQAKSKGVSFDVMFDSLTEEWFIGDQMRINQILTNLLSNAVKFTSDGGSVKLVISQQETQTDSVHIHFEVSDTGIGMDSEYLTHIWTPFEQADSSISRRFGGTGLGLSITKKLVDLMGGNISVESQLGKGTVFKVDLNLAKAEQPKDSETYDFSSLNVLIADDDSCTRDYITQMFSQTGTRCLAVNSGSAAIEAFEAAKKRSEPFTVCLIDWKMPNMDGLETAAKLHSIAGEQLPVVVISAYDCSEIRKPAAEVGVSMFIEKPLFRSSLFDMLVNVTKDQYPKNKKTTKAFNFEGIRVLLAEDNEMNMEIAKRILESSGIKTDSAWNGEEAVRMFTASEPGSYDLILMDVHMPVMDGHTATDEIRKSQHPDAKNIPIIAMTADAFAENVAESLAAGMNDHISKPIDINNLFKIIGKYTAKKG